MREQPTDDLSFPASVGFRGPLPATAPARDSAVAVIVYVVLLSVVPPLLVVPGLGAAGRPAALLGIMMLGWWGLTRFLPHDIPSRAIAIRWALLVYMLTFVASMIVGLDRGLDGLEARSMYRSLLLALSFCGVTLVLTDGLRTFASVERVLRWVVGLGAVGAVAGVIQFWFKYDIVQSITIPGLVKNRDDPGIGTRGSADFARVSGFARHPIEFGVIMAALLPISIHLATHSAHSSRWKKWVAPVLIATTVPLSISRSGILALAAGMAVYALGWSWRQRANFAVIAIIFAVGFQAVTPGLLGTIRSLFVGLENDNSVTGRTEDFDATSRYIQERPWLGRGPGTFVIERYRLLDNEYLGTLIERGWIGLASLAFLLICSGATAIWLVRHATDERMSSLSRALGANVVVAIIVLGTFDALSFPIYSGLLFVVIGCLGALYRISTEQRTADSSWGWPGVVSNQPLGGKHG